MALSEKDAEGLIKELRKSNKDYFVKTLNLSEEESEFLLDAWKTYVKECPEVLKHSRFRCLDSFIRGYLAHVDFIHVKGGLTNLSALRPQKMGQK